MKTYKKIILGIALILIIFIALLIGINIGNKNSIQKPLSELQKLTDAREENSFVKTKDHLAEVNSSVELIWESIRNSETLSSKTDSSGNPIYGSVTDIASLEAAINADNQNLIDSIKNDPNKYGITANIIQNMKLQGFSFGTVQTPGIYIAQGADTQSKPEFAQGYYNDFTTSGTVLHNSGYVSGCAWSRYMIVRANAGDYINGHGSLIGIIPTT